MITINNLTLITNFIASGKKKSVQSKQTQTNNINNVKLPDICLYGLQDAGICYVHYKMGCFSYYPYVKGEILLSDEFSGCAMIQFSMDNNNYIGHIAMDNQYSFTNNGEAWKLFCQHYKLKIHNVFYPYRASELEYCFKEIIQRTGRDANVLGVIINDVCYSCVMTMTDCKIVKIIQWTNTNNTFLDKNSQQVLASSNKESCCVLL